MHRLKSLILAVGLAAAAPLAAQVGLSPPKLDITLDESGKPSTHSIRIVNFGDQPVEVQVVVYNWDMDDDNQVRILPPDEQSLDQWMVLNPLRFTLPAEGSQAVRFSIRPKVKPEPGEHRAMIFFEQVPPADKAPEIRFVFRLGAAVYGQVGELTRIGELHSAEAGDLAASFDVSSVGTANMRFSGQYAVWPAAAFPGAENTAAIEELEEAGATLPEPIVQAGPLPPTAVLPGTRRKIKLGFAEALEAGDYVLDLNGALGETVVDMAVPFSATGEEITRSGRIHGIERVGSTISFDVSSLGTARVAFDGQYAIWPAPSYPGAKQTPPLDGLAEGRAQLPESVLEAGLLPVEPVLPNDRRKILLQLEQAPPPGDYVLDLNGSLGKAAIDLGVPFTVEAPASKPPSP